MTEPAGLRDTGYLRSDELPGDAALGYLWTDRPRTNVFHLPVLGTGDGGIYSTAADLSRFWAALFAGEIVSVDAVVEMVRPRSDWPEEERRYGLGFHLHATTDVVWLEGYDAGVSFTSTHELDRRITATVISNTAEGAWPFVRAIRPRARDLGSDPQCGRRRWSAPPSTSSRNIREPLGSLGFGGPRRWVHHPHVRLHVDAFVPLTIDLDRHQRT